RDVIPSVWRRVDRGKIVHFSLFCFPSLFNSSRFSAPERREMAALCLCRLVPFRGLIICKLPCSFVHERTLPPRTFAGSPTGDPGGSRRRKTQEKIAGIDHRSADFAE